jgi:hypothetical protein
MKYRGINYTIDKRPVYGQPHRTSWSGQILFPGKPKSLSSITSESRSSFIGVIKYEIDKHFERLNSGCDDDELLGMARSLLLYAKGYKSYERRLRALQEQRQFAELTKDELYDVIDRVCDLAKRMIEAQHVKVDRPGLVAKLRKMTVKNGCTPGEAAAAKEKLRQLLETA